MNVSTRNDPHTGAGYAVSLDPDTGAFTATAYGHGRRRLAFQAWEPGGTTRDEAVAWARGVVARRCAACDVSPRDVTDHAEPEPDEDYAECDACGKGDLDRDDVTWIAPGTYACQACASMTAPVDYATASAVGDGRALVSDGSWRSCDECGRVESNDEAGPDWPGGVCGECVAAAIEAPR